MGEAYRFPVPVDEHAADGAPGAEQWRSLTWAQTATRVYAVAGRPAVAGHQPGGPGRADVLHPAGVGHRRPRQHVRGRGHHGRLPEHQRRRDGLHPLRLGLQGDLRREREAARQGRRRARPAARAAHRRPLRRHRPGRRGARAERAHPGRAGAARRRVPGAAPGRRAAGRRRARQGAAGDPDLHLRHHRPPQGRAAGPRLLGVPGAGAGGERAAARGRRAVHVAAAVARVRQEPDLRPDRHRSRDGAGRPGGPDHPQPAGDPPDHDGLGAAHLREGLQRHRRQGPGRGRRQVQDLHVGGEDRPRLRPGHPGQPDRHRARQRPAGAAGAARGGRQAGVRQDPDRVRRADARLGLRQCRAGTRDRLLLHAASACPSWRATA